MKDKIDKKIEEIIGTRKDIIDLPSTGSHEGDRDRVIAYEKLKKKLTNLFNTEVQKAREEAVKGFADFLDFRIPEVVDDYLQSLDKGDK